MISKARIYDINFKIPEFSDLSVFEHGVVVVGATQASLRFSWTIISRVSRERSEEGKTSPGKMLCWCQNRPDCFELTVQWSSFGMRRRTSCLCKAFTSLWTKIWEEMSPGPCLSCATALKAKGSKLKKGTGECMTYHTRRVHVKIYLLRVLR